MSLSLSIRGFLSPEAKHCKLPVVDSLLQTAIEHHVINC